MKPKPNTIRNFLHVKDSCIAIMNIIIYIKLKAGLNNPCLIYSLKYSYGRRPSSKGSHVSVMSVEPIEVFWWRPTIRLCIYQQIYCQAQSQSNQVGQHQQHELLQQTLINSTIVTVLFIALPIALKTISLEPFSCIIYGQ